MNKKEIIEALEKLNPYPESVFTEPLKSDYILMKRVLIDAGLTSDRFFASFGRLVWNNCITQLKELSDEEED